MAQSGDTRQRSILEQAEAALATTSTVGQLDKVKKRIASVRRYARRAATRRELLRDTAVLGLRAERRLGQILRDLPLARSSKGNQYTGHVKSSAASEQVFLRDLGIGRADSSRAQAIASIPDEVFEDYVLEVSQQGNSPSVAGLLRRATPGKAKTSQEDRKAIRRLNAAARKLQTLGKKRQRFATVFVDIRWVDAYSRQTVVDLQGLAIGQVAAADANIFVWASNSTISASVDALRKWGFRYTGTVVLHHKTAASSNWLDRQSFLMVGARGQSEIDRTMLPRGQSSPKSQAEARAWVRKLVQASSPAPYLALSEVSISSRKEWTQCRFK